METPTPGQLADELLAAAEPPSEAEQHLAIGLYRLLAEGRPVETAVLAEYAGWETADVDAALRRRRGLVTDEQRRVIGFLGLSIQPTRHRLTVNGTLLYAWCAYDTLFLPELLGSSAEVESRCPVTDERIALTVDRTEVVNARPPGIVLSYLHRHKPLDQDVIKTFCRYIHFFASPPAAAEWTSEHEGTFAISLAEASEIARVANRGRYPLMFTRSA